ncbi:MarR family winged helix-turn-helix transcriptional regulator [Sphingomonas sp.]|uniref:MarR family winged helix-turn-helix transcriptional regulator n=1 Tax=Sphingomonas sp. TaxID=28214 RepID=UPI0031DF0F82
MTGEPFDLEAYFPFFLGTIANRWTTTSSKIYLTEFGIGIGEWRVLASVRAQGVASAQMVVNLIAMDAGAVSRSMAKLVEEGLVEPLSGRFAGRTKPYHLTDKGHELYPRILRTAREREQILLGALTDAEKRQLIALMRKIMTRVDAL